MDSFDNNINLAHKYLPFPFDEFNENNGAKIYDEIINCPLVEEDTDRVT